MTPLSPRALLIPLAATAVAAIYATSLTGTVTGPDGDPLIGASVRLLTSDSTFVTGGVTDLDGHFSLTEPDSGRYILEAAYTGYASTALPVDLPAGDSTVEAGVISLAERSHTLREVSVVAVKTQVKVKEDTIEYNADSYQTRPNAVIEDLIKRLPGVEVGSDGSITANGQSVTKILVDGKEFFGEDPTVATKNIPVDIVDKLQVVNRKSDMARLTGVEDGEEETVINLTVKKGKNQGWFGNVEGGYGTDDRYKGNFTLNRFWNGNQITLLGNANNINDAGFNDGNAGRFHHFGGDNGINTTQSLGLNFNVGRQDESLRVGGNIFFSHSDRHTLEQRDRTYLTGESPSSASSGSSRKDKSYNLRADFRILWKPDSFNTLELRPRVNYNNIRTLSLDSTLTYSPTALLTRSFNDETSRGNSVEAGIRAIYSHQFRNHPGRSFSVSANYSHSNVKQDGTALSLNRFYDFSEPDDDSDQLTDNRTWTNTLGGRLSWTEPLGDSSRGNFITVAYRMNYKWNNADKYTDLLDPTTGTYALDPELSNRFRNHYFDQDIRVGYKRVTSAYTLDAGLSAVPQSSESVNLIDAAKSIPTRNTFNIAPYLRFRRKWGKATSLNIFYSGRASQPSMTQLQPVVDQSDPMDIIVGNPNLDPSFSHNLRLRLQNYDAESQRSLMTMLFGRVTQNSVVSRTSYSPTTGGRTTTYENVNGVWNLRLMNMFSQPLGASKLWLFTSHLMLGYTRDVGFSNGERNNSGTFDFDIHPSIAFRPANLDLEIRPLYHLKRTTNSLANVTNSTVHTYGATFNGSWYTPWGISLNTDLTYEGTKGYARGYDENSWLWNASIAYQFLRDKSLTLSLTAYDLLGQKSSVSRTVNANYIDDSRFNTLTRYFMATVTWTFNTFGKGNEPKSNDIMRMGPPGPPPGAMHRH